jgi:hypothetical protein
VGHEREAEALGERGHLGHGEHVPSGAPQHHDVRVVDHAGLRDAIQVAKGLGEEDLALEATEPGVELEEEQAGVGEHEAGRLHAPHPAAEVQVVRRGVVLHFLAWREVIPPGRLFGDLADSMAAQKAVKAG